MAREPVPSAAESRILTAVLNGRAEARPLQILSFWTGSEERGDAVLYWTNGATKAGRRSIQRGRRFPHRNWRDEESRKPLALARPHPYNPLTGIMFSCGEWAGARMILGTGHGECQ